MSPDVEVRSFVSVPVASIIYLSTLGTSRPSAAAAISVAVQYFVFGLDGVAPPLVAPKMRFSFSFFLRFFSSSSESSRISPRSVASRFSSSLACLVFSFTAPSPAPCGLSCVSTGANLPCPVAPRPRPST